jgi:hypothetical protein
MRIAAVLTATLHNIHESARFKTGAFRFWGCLPVPESSADELLPMSAGCRAGRSRRPFYSQRKA